MLIDGSFLIVVKDRKWAYMQHMLRVRGYYSSGDLDHLHYVISARISRFYAITKLPASFYSHLYSIIINTAIQLPTYKRHEI